MKGNVDILKNNENFLIVSNHLSYLDVIAILGQQPTSFVTSVEMKKTPILGQLCELGGCLFVERRNKNNLGNEIIEITDALKDNLDVVIFPEATSTNGEEVRKFKRPLFSSAIDAKKRVLPITLNYKSIIRKTLKEKIERRNRDCICWYGDMTFTDHLLGLFKLKEVQLDIIVGEPIAYDSVESYTELADLSHSKVIMNHNPFI